MGKKVPKNRTRRKCRLKSVLPCMKRKGSAFLYVRNDWVVVNMLLRSLHEAGGRSGWTDWFAANHSQEGKDQ